MHNTMTRYWARQGTPAWIPYPGPVLLFQVLNLALPPLCESKQSAPHQRHPSCAPEPPGSLSLPTVIQTQLLQQWCMVCLVLGFKINTCLALLEHSLYRSSYLEMIGPCRPAIAGSSVHWPCPWFQHRVPYAALRLTTKVQTTEADRAGRAISTGSIYASSPPENCCQCDL